MIASLPWYDFDGTADLHDFLWKTMRRHFQQEQISPLPVELDRKTRPLDSLFDTNLLLTQTCGYDVAYEIPAKIKVIATPVYETEGACDGLYSSFFVSRKKSKMTDLKTALSQRSATFKFLDKVAGFQRRRL